MFRRTLIACAISALALCALCAGSASAAALCTGANTVIASEAARQQAVQAVLCLVNRQRAQRGSRALRASAPLGAAADGHSANMVAGAFFSHASSNGDSVRTRVMRTGYIRASRHTLVGETIAWGAGTYATPRQLVTSFMRSPMHRDTLLDRRYRDAGVGMTLGAPLANVSGAAATLTLDFGRR